MDECSVIYAHQDDRSINQYGTDDSDVIQLGTGQFDAPGGLSLRWKLVFAAEFLVSTATVVNIQYLSFLLAKLKERQMKAKNIPKQANRVMV